MNAGAQLIPVANFSRDMVDLFYVSGALSGSGGAAAASDRGGTSVTLFRMGYACTQVRVMFVNYCCIGGDTQNTTTLSVQASIATVPDSTTIAPIRFLFGGISVASITAGGQIWSDILTIPGGLAANQEVSIRTYVSIPAGGQFPLGCYSAGSVFNGFTATCGNNYPQYTTSGTANANGSNQIMTLGTTGSWQSGNNVYVYGPVSIDGYATDGIKRPVFAIVGDSIAQGRNDAADQTGGAIVRTLMQQGIPYYNMARAGELLSQVYEASAGLNQYSGRFQRLQRCTGIIEEYATNDMTYNGTGNPGATFATIRTQKLQFWANIATFGAPIWVCTLFPRTSAANYPASAQTVNGNNAQYQLYNAWLRAPASAGVGNSAAADCAANGIPWAGCIDWASYLESDANNTTPGGPSAPVTGGVWWNGTDNATLYTSEGTHPTTAGHLLCMPAFAPYYSAFAATTPLNPTTSSGSGGYRGFFRR